jgi:hypothetical protein
MTEVIKCIRQIRQKFVLGLLILSCVVGLIVPPAQAVELPTALNTTNNPHVSIANTDQLLLYMNAQNLVDHWNNLVIRAEQGEEQLQMMRESGVFSDDFKLTFDLGDKKYEFGLSDPEAVQFYNSFVNGLKKYRYNVASNVEVVEFEKDSLTFNFKHWIYFNDKLAVVGDDQAHMSRRNGKFSLDSAYLRLIRFDTAGAY